MSLEQFHLSISCDEGDKDMKRIPDLFSKQRINRNKLYESQRFVIKVYETGMKHVVGGFSVVQSGKCRGSIWWMSSYGNCLRASR